MLWCKSEAPPASSHVPWGWWPHPCPHRVATTAPLFTSCPPFPTTPWLGGARSPTTDGETEARVPSQPRMEQVRPLPSWGQGTRSAGSEAPGWGRRGQSGGLGGVSGGILPHPRYKYLYFLLLSGVYIRRGVGGSVPATVLGHGGVTPKCPEMPLGRAQGNKGPDLGVPHRAGWPVTGCPEWAPHRADVGTKVAPEGTGMSSR